MHAGSGAGARLTAADDRHEEKGQLGMSLQLLRASNLTMTRLHLALQSGDRRLAMMAVDGLMDIDAEIEAFVADLAQRTGNDPHEDDHMRALSGYLAHQKAAIAVEKHALTGMVGRVEAATPHPTPALEEFPVGPPPPPVQPTPVQTAEEEPTQEEAPQRWPTGLVFILIFVPLAAIAAVAILALK